MHERVYQQPCTNSLGHASDNISSYTSSALIATVMFSLKRHSLSQHARQGSLYLVLAFETSASIVFYLSLLYSFACMTLSRPFPPRSCSRTKSPSPFRPSIAPRVILSVHFLPGISLSIPAIPIHSWAVSAPVSPRVSVSFSLTFPSAHHIMQMLYPSLSSPDYSPLSTPLPPPVNLPPFTRPVVAKFPTHFILASILVFLISSSMYLFAYLKIIVFFLF